MKYKVFLIKPFFLALFGAAAISAFAADKTAVSKAEITLPSFGGERHELTVEGHNAFVILAKDASPKKKDKRPWIWYAPTLVSQKIPGPELEWLFLHLLRAGFAVAGVDVGESYGNPAGRHIFTQFHARATKEFGLSRKACLLPQSRGGLMLYNWAVEHPKNVQCIGGIYTVCNLASYPGLDKAAPAYGMTQERLAAQLTKHNPIDRIAPLAKAKVSIFHIHGDVDKLVPLETNAGKLVERYRALGGPAQLVIVPGKGHQVCPEFFESETLLDFFLKQAGVKSTDSAR